LGRRLSAQSAGAIWKIDDKSGADRKQRQAVAQLLAEGFEAKGTREVSRLLGHEDQRIRLKAQFELVDRTESEALTKESNGGERIKRIHAVWGLGQLARQGDSLATDQLLYLLNDDDSEMQAQVIKVLADLDPGSFDGDRLIRFLASSDPRVRFQAGLAIGNHGVEEAFGAVVGMIESNGGEDLYLRHSGIMALKGIGGAERFSSHGSEEVRISAVVALRKSRSPAVVSFLKDSSEFVQEKQNALMALASIDLPEAHSVIGQWAAKLESASVPVTLLLDVIEAAKKVGFDDAVAAFEASRPANDPNGPYLESLEGGNPEAGEKVVNMHLGGQCVRCHRFSSELGSKIGPNLKSIGSSKDRAYLLRSLIDPQADIAPGYGVVSITLKDGSTASGIAGNEDSDSIGILSVDREDAQRIPKSNIASKTDPISTMPPMGFVLTKRELRDVVAYLASLDDGK